MKTASRRNTSCAAGSDHFYTTNWSELGSGGLGYVYEGIQCYVFPSAGHGNAALYRYWNPGGTDHFYTTNWSELGSGNYGWNFEQVHGFVPAGPGASAAGTIDQQAPATFTVDRVGVTDPATDAPPSFLVGTAADRGASRTPATGLL